MPTVLNYTPGQQVTVFQEIIDATGARTDDGYTPVVTRIIVPGFTLATGTYPIAMNRLDTGLYYYQFNLPSGASAVGSYLVDIVFLNPVTNVLNNNTYQIVVTAPFGNFGISVVVPS